jgi:hypothetical protein
MGKEWLPLRRINGPNLKTVTAKPASSYDTPGTPNKNSSNNPSGSGSRSVPKNGGTSGGGGGNGLRSCSNFQNFRYPPPGSGPRASSSKGTQDDPVDLESSDGSAYEASPSPTLSSRPASFTSSSLTRRVRLTKLA